MLYAILLSLGFSMCHSVGDETKIDELNTVEKNTSTIQSGSSNDTTKAIRRKKDVL